MYIGKTRVPLNVLLLSIVTCGIYGLFWYYTCATDINGITGQERVNPILFILSHFIPFLPLVFVHKIDQTFIEIGQREGTRYESKFVLWLVLYLVGIGYLVFMYQSQDELNKVWQIRSGGVNRG
ncbi:MAG: DUF4234 domain-containing protein [Oscillospiraceae bacterium]|nr:DUF4234 domain-containing protein [Oscillospiraceae bacterium]